LFRGALGKNVIDRYEMRRIIKRLRPKIQAASSQGAFCLVQPCTRRSLA